MDRLTRSTIIFIFTLLRASLAEPPNRKPQIVVSRPPQTRFTGRKNVVQPRNHKTNPKIAYIVLGPRSVYFFLFSLLLSQPLPMVLPLPQPASPAAGRPQPRSPRPHLPRMRPPPAELVPAAPTLPAPCSLAAHFCRPPAPNSGELWLDSGDSGARTG